MRISTCGAILSLVLFSVSVSAQSAPFMRFIFTGQPLSMERTSDTGFILSTSNSVIKLDSTGAVQWGKSFSSPGLIAIETVRQTGSGFIAAGAFGADAWIVNFNSAGEIVWQKTFTGRYSDSFSDIRQTNDGGYIVVGNTASFGALAGDGWCLKLNASGGIVWQKMFKVDKADGFSRVIQTTDGGYAIAGSGFLDPALGWDARIIKLDAAGNMKWEKAYGGPGNDFVGSIEQTSDGGYVLAGETASSGNLFVSDGWLLKVDANGASQWHKTYGGHLRDTFASVRQTEDGGFIVAGTTSSYGKGSTDVWLMKVNQTGGQVWMRTYGLASSDSGTTALELPDGSYVITGAINRQLGTAADAFLLQTRENGDNTSLCNTQFIKRQRAVSKNFTLKTSTVVPSIVKTNAAVRSPASSPKSLAPDTFLYCS